MVHSHNRSCGSMSTALGSPWGRLAVAFPENRIEGCQSVVCTEGQISIPCRLPLSPDISSQLCGISDAHIIARAPQIRASPGRLSSPFNPMEAQSDNKVWLIHRGVDPSFVSRKRPPGRTKPKRFQNAKSPQIRICYQYSSGRRPATTLRLACTWPSHCIGSPNI